MTSSTPGLSPRKSPLPKNASSTTRTPNAAQTSIESLTHSMVRGSLLYGTLFISPIASEAISTPLALAASWNCCRTSARRRCMSLASVPRLTCTPSRPICLARANAEGSASLPMDQSHAPILNRRLSAAAKSGEKFAATASPLATKPERRSISRREIFNTDWLGFISTQQFRLSVLSNLPPVFPVCASCLAR